MPSRALLVTEYQQKFCPILAKFIFHSRVPINCEVISVTTYITMFMEMAFRTFFNFTRIVSAFKRKIISYIGASLKDPSSF
jgi:hypothetical protein